MTYLGRIHNGVAVLTPPISLPEGTPVRIEVEQPHVKSWANKSIEELAREQNVKPMVYLAHLKIDWPEEESIDDLMALVREARR
jgi:hypothetical protein